MEGEQRIFILDVSLDSIAVGGLQVCRKIAFAKKKFIVNLSEMEKKIRCVKSNRAYKAKEIQKSCIARYTDINTFIYIFKYIWFTHYCVFGRCTSDDGTCWQTTV